MFKACSPDQIERFTEKGILLTSGKVLEADVIVTATGLVMQMLGGIKPTVDGTPVRAHPGDCVVLPHGTVQTPAYMPVGTQGAVRSVHGDWQIRGESGAAGNGAAAQGAWVKANSWWFTQRAFSI